MVDNIIHVYGQGKKYHDRQTFTDDNGKEFRGTIELAKLYFQALNPGKTIMISALSKQPEQANWFKLV